MKNSPKADSAFDKFFERITPEIATTFTDTQLNAIKEVFSSTSIGSNHSVDIRFSLPVWGRRFYVVFLAGPERRSLKRIRTQKINARAWTPANIIVISLFFILLITSLFSVYYSAIKISSSEVVVCQHPVSIPWISNQIECENSGRTWRGGECLDFHHNPNF